MRQTSRQGDKETRRQESTRTTSLSAGLPVSLSTLVIGCGNDLRGDDALGPLAATAVAAWDMPGVQALAVHQLMPELAEALAEADLAIFVDACAPVAPPSPDQPAGYPLGGASLVPHQRGKGADLPLSPAWERGIGGEGEEFVSVQPIEPAAADSALGHTGDPRALLALTRALYGRCPLAWSITVPARSFAFGAGLSAMAERGLAAALRHIDDLIVNATYATNRG
jgi:Ni,Fe-hydrogenase maturation factor